MVIHVREDYGDDWDEDQYKDWINENIGEKVNKNWALALAAVSEKFPGTSLDKHIDQEIDVLFDDHGRDYTNTKVDVDETRKLHIPVNFDPYENDDALDSLFETVNQVLGEIKFEKGSAPRYRGSLEHPEIVSADTIDFDHNSVTIPLEFTYTYHYEDSPY